MLVVAGWFLGCLILMEHDTQNVLSIRAAKNQVFFKVYFKLGIQKWKILKLLLCLASVAQGCA